ncbi:hypothetical protein O181_081869 [Austropuccinia psidii MF-1]|uniref:Uncharacterized protein n=1 Tax=Austropuccinia psidii MF-1 TaxID=1389203 RepID=A0A9Q3IKI2_9BASI|nr:hypothetical protein [Austropuccinia psidii MF-1]
MIDEEESNSLTSSRLSLWKEAGCGILKGEECSSSRPLEVSYNLMDPRNLNSLSKENVGDEGQNNAGDSILIWGKEESSAELKADDKAEDLTAIGLLENEVKEDELSKLINETDSSRNFSKIF